MGSRLADDQVDFAYRWEGKALSEFHELSMVAITGETLSFEKYKDQACLVVNLASQ